MIRIAVIVPTYNRPDALAAVLRGYADQTDMDFELVVADDGSAADTTRLVEQFSASTPLKVSYVWQEDRGYRLAAVRNRAVARTDAEYIVFTDGDCVPSRTFVHQHRRLAEPGWFLSGNRVLLSERFTRMVLEQGLPIQRWTWANWTRARASGNINRLTPLVRLPDGSFRKRNAHIWEGAKTCNLSAWRADLLRVNGVDESYSGWGLEDSDLVIRLIRAGVLHKSARFAAPVFHLWHKENDRGALPENRRRLSEVQRSNRIQALLGLDQYLQPTP